MGIWLGIWLCIMLPLSIIGAYEIGRRGPIEVFRRIIHGD
jgi:hypothetical protein